MDQKKILDFWNSRSIIKDDYIAARNGLDNRLIFDLKLIKNYLKNDYKVLDLGCGTGLISKSIVDNIGHIVAVDFVKDFIERINHEKITTIHSDLLSFQQNEKFDVILLFGVFNYFEINDVEIICKKIQKMLKKDGTIIIKHQCGRSKKVIIDKFSEELNHHYHAVYRELDSEVKNLEKFFHVEIVNIYPKELNKWNDTHHYAFICKLKDENNGR